VSVDFTRNPRLTKERAMMTSNEVDSQKGSSSSGSSSTEKEDSAVKQPAPSTSPFEPEVRERLNDVRTKILSGGIYGMVYGVLVGGVVHVTLDKVLMRSGVAKRLSLKYPSLRIPHKFPKNSFLPTILFVGAMASFASACVKGRNSLNLVTDVWTVNSNPKSAYQGQLNKNKYDLYKEQEESFERRTARINEIKAAKEKEIEHKTWRGG
jgi:hypothetical protein